MGNYQLFYSKEKLIAKKNKVRRIEVSPTVFDGSQAPLDGTLVVSPTGAVGSCIKLFGKSPGRSLHQSSTSNKQNPMEIIL